MQPSVQWAIDGQVLDVGVWEPHDCDGKPAFPRSYAYFCPGCGETWAKVRVFGAQWTVWERACSRCPAAAHSGEPPGTLWMSWNHGWNRLMPTHVLAREMELLFGLYERKMK